MRDRDPASDPPPHVPAPAATADAGRLAALGRRVASYLVLAFQLGLCLIVVYRFDIESRAFLNLGILTFFGFSVHYFLPRRWRMPFFLLLSLAAIELVFGFQLERWSSAGLLEGAWIIGLGLALVGITYLPLPFGVRAGLLVAVAGGLALARAGTLAVPWSSAIWPVLGSMFMFRLLLYLQYHRQEGRHARPVETLSYFFLLPNVCFPLFPVVDFRTFQRTYYDEPDRDRIYQSGLRWIFRGLLHLLAYRFVYQNLVMSASEVVSLGDLAQYLVWPFLLYLRVSGQFHLIVGMLHLFGFNLPETHHLYYLSSSFTDFWRRINIYWKDFMMRVFYYPAFFRLRRHGATLGLVLATFVVFAATWVLHAYQWFWIRGTFLLAWNDALFWLVLAVLVVANVVLETKRGRRRALEGTTLPWSAAAARGLRAAGTFAVICVLWSFWSEESASVWLATWRAVAEARPADLGLLPLLLLGALVVAVPAALAARRPVARPLDVPTSAALTTAAALLVIAVSFPQVQAPLGWKAKEVIADLGRSELNRRDFALLERGYYENLLAVERFNPELWEVYRTKPADWTALGDTDAVRWTDSLPYYELLPSRSTLHHGATVRTNRWGMRDRDYALDPPPGTVRIALLGSSFVMGSGVENDEVFEAVLERRLNLDGGGSDGSDRNDRREGLRYEILNFGVGGWSPLEHLAVLEKKAFGFDPDLVLYVAHRDDWLPLLRHLVKAQQLGVAIPYPGLERLMLASGVDGEGPESESVGAGVQRLKPHGMEALGLVYRRIAEECRERRAVPVWVYLPRPEDEERGPAPPDEVRLAQEAGFAVLDLAGVYDDHDLSSLWVARWDHHPNAEGNRLIADRLYDLLERRDGLLARVRSRGGRWAATADPERGRQALLPAADRQETP